MWIKIEALLCCVIAISFAANESQTKKNDDSRGKRNLEYSISHHLSVPNYRAEKRISTGLQIPQVPHYPLFFPVQKPYVPYRKGRPNLSTPPYAVQMEPLVHYSQPDPLYDSTGLTFIAEATNDIKGKDDQIREHSHTSRSIYGQPPPSKHIIERPVYIKEPEPIIEIIIKESNVTLPPLPIPPVTVTPKKKEQVQVFYVKYKKNPNVYGKDSIVYDKPIPAISPPVPDEPVQVEPPIINYGISNSPTLPPPPSTTLRAIVKPDSESYHANKGIHITFGKQENEQYKRSNDDANEESAPEPAISHPQVTSPISRPQGRQFNSFPDRPFLPQSSFFQKRPISPPNHIYPNLSPPPSFNSGNQRFPPPVPPFNQPPPLFKPPIQFGRQFPQKQQSQFNQQLPTTRSPLNFQSQSFPPRITPPSFQQLPGFQQAQFNPPLPHRQPVPYQPFEQLRNQQPLPSSQISFPRPHSHFPINQQTPQTNQQQSFSSQFNNEHKNVLATQQQFQHNTKNDEAIRQQQFQHNTKNDEAIRQQQFQHNTKNDEAIRQQQFLHNTKNDETIRQQQFQHNSPRQQIQNQPSFSTQQLPVPQQIPFLQQHTNQQQFSTHNPNEPERFIPPGGELIHSIPKFEQHISVPFGSNQPQPLALHQPQIPNAQQQQQHYQQQQNQQHLLHIQNQHPVLQLNQQQATIQQQPQQQQQQQQQQHQQQQQQQLQQQQQQLHQHQQQQQQRLQQQFKVQQNLNNQEYNLQIQQQFKQPVTNQPLQIQYNQSPQQNFVTNVPLIQDQNKNQHIFIQTQQSTSKPIVQVSTVPYTLSTTTTETSKISTESSKNDPEEINLKDLNIELPDEVPDELRQQLLSSGILKNAQISILDYDKVGDIPLSALPPEQLANFYGAGGGQQIAAGSERVPQIVTKEGEPVKEDIAADNLEMEVAESNISEVREEPPVEMKVVHYNPQTEEGQKIQQSYVKEGATQADPVALDDQQYNRYLPVKVNGAAFPIPDIPELKGRSIASVVVLAPVEVGPQEGSRKVRDVNDNNKNTRALASEALKVLIKNPTAENYKDWLEKENKTVPDKQAVVLLVTGGNKESSGEKEIFMYDLATQTVNKLSGELSTAFVDAAETNSHQTNAPIAAASSNVVETRVPYVNKETSDGKDSKTIDTGADLINSASEYKENKTPLTEASE